MPKKTTTAATKQNTTKKGQSEDQPKKLRKRQRADGRFQVNATIGHDENGKPIRKSFYGATKSEAEKKAEDYKRSHNAGYRLDKQNVTVGEFIDEFKDTYDFAKSKTTILHLNNIKNDLGYIKLSELTEADIIRGMKSHEGRVTSYYKRYVSMIRKICKVAYKNKYITTNPTEDITIEGKKPGTHRLLEPWEQQFILDHALANTALFHAVVLMLTGMRIGELEYLPWENIDFSNKVIHVCGTTTFSRSVNGIQVHFKDSPKTDAGFREIPISTKLKKLLFSIPEAFRKDRYWFFYDFENPQASPDDIDLDKERTKVRTRQRYINQLTRYIKAHKNAWAKEKKIALSEQPDIRFHDLRHTYATFLYEARVDEKTAAKIMGHADVQITMRLYQHLSLIREQDSRDMLYDYFDKKFT